MAPLIRLQTCLISSNFFTIKALLFGHLKAFIMKQHDRNPVNQENTADGWKYNKVWSYAGAGPSRFDSAQPNKLLE